MTTTARLRDDVGRDRSALHQMAADESMLDEVSAGATAVLRLYTWSRPALSLGRFQPDEDADADACGRHGVEIVRRPSGGRALLHGGDLTYAIALARPAEPVHATYALIGGALVDGLARLGVHAEIARHDGPSGPACLTGVAGADLRVGDRKLCGSAMVRRGWAVLQHGSILLERLALDESDVLHSTDRRALHRATVTLEELGATCEPRTVARALADGFSNTLDLDLHLRSSAPLPSAATGPSLQR